MVKTRAMLLLSPIFSRVWPCHRTQPLSLPRGHTTLPATFVFCHWCQTHPQARSNPPRETAKVQLLTVSPRWGFLTSSPLFPKKVLMSGHIWELLFSLACRIHALWTEKERENLRAEVPRVRPRDNPPGALAVARGAHGKKVRSLAFLKQHPEAEPQVMLPACPRQVWVTYRDREMRGERRGFQPF